MTEFITEPVWHKKAKVIRKPILAKEAIEIAGLNWEVKKQKIYFNSKRDGEDGEDSLEEIPSHYAIVRDDTKVVFGICGKNYKIYQNNQAFDWLNSFIEKGELEIDSAMSFDGGRRVSIACKVNTPPIEIMSGDVTECYLHFKNDHTGKASIGFILAPVRKVCSNTLAMSDEMFAETSHYGRFKVKHVGDIKGKVEEIKAIIDFQKRKFKDGMDCYKDLLKYNLPRHKLREYLEEVFAADLKSKKIYCLENELAEPSIFDVGIVRNVMFHYQKTCEEMPGIEGTLYSAVQAVSGAVTHSNNRSAIQSQLFGRGQQVMEKSLKQALLMMR